MYQKFTWKDTHGYIDLVMWPAHSQNTRVLFATTWRVFQGQHLERNLKISTRHMVSVSDQISSYTKITLSCTRCVTVDTSHSIARSHNFLNTKPISAVLDYISKSWDWLRFEGSLS